VTAVSIKTTERQTVSVFWFSQYLMNVFLTTTFSTTTTATALMNKNTAFSTTTTITTGRGSVCLPLSFVLRRDWKADRRWLCIDPLQSLSK